jgi:hypothetical protein
VFAITPVVQRTAPNGGTVRVLYAFVHYSA